MAARKNQSLEKKAKTTKIISVKNKCCQCGFQTLQAVARAKGFEIISNKQRKNISKKDIIYG